MKHDFDTIIIGSGLAGLSVALSLPSNHRIAILSKDALINTASDKAQGGIAAVWDSQDSFERHINDTLVAGAGLCEKEAVTHIVEHSTDALQWLLSHQVDFTRNESDQQLHLTLEGGHSWRRIAHASDKTGHVITQTLQSLLGKCPNIHIFEQRTSVALLTSRENASECIGVKVLNRQSGEMETFLAPNTVLATGGTGQLFTHTTNPEIATGDGIAMAWRAGCRVANMEFIQFHPTALALPNAPTFLISEAVRGEGGVLLRPDGSRFMPSYDKRAELAPRDIVARAIESEMKKNGTSHVLLDISHKPKEQILHHFPMIHETCLSHGLDICTTPIPVAPASHYTCGGVLVNRNGQTDLKGLYCAGETAYTGLHGANRLASNSLLECIVTGRSIANSITAGLPWETPAVYEHTIHISPAPASNSQPEASHAPNKNSLRQLMTQCFGIVRNDAGMQTALSQLKSWKAQLLNNSVAKDYAFPSRSVETSRKVAHFSASNCLQDSNLNEIELNNMLDVACLMLQCGLARKESRGLHYTTDYPNKAETAKPTVLSPVFS
ncbi:L-aspartate oxidase [Advenella sp. RU8]|uniref:L-aspartate oxidase n=1 Tax=Advenella sp. RU8 TaxID=3399575 RepID=UPI003AB0DBFA